MTQDVSHGRPISRIGLHVIGLRFLATAVFLAAAARQARATTITFSPIDLNFTVAERSLFSGAVAVFEDDNPAAGPGDFVATIDWGDTTSSTATIGLSSAAFTVLGSHTYLDEGAFTVTVTVKDQPPAGSATTTYTATVTEADSLSGTPVTFSTLTGVPFTGVVANFSDTLLSASPGDFTATINWGDATTSVGTIAGGSGSFQVSGTHTYVGSGTFSVVVTLTDDAPGTATAQVTSTARVSNVMTITAVSFSVPEATLFNLPVATFTDSDTTKTPGSFTATINWGDGSTSAGTINGGSGSFTLTGQHTYADEGMFTLTVTASEILPGTATASTALGRATVTEADVLSGTPMTFTPVVTVPFTGPVATFSDTNATNVPGGFTATINWGDATTSAGTVTGGGGSFQVRGTHTYVGSGTFSVVVTLTDNAPGTATAQVISTAHVSSLLSVTASSFSVAEATLFNRAVATFLDTDTTKTPASFTATINWGDATTSAGTVTGGSGSFTLTGQHTYADEGAFAVTVAVSSATASGSGTGNATVTEADVLSGTPMTFTPVVTVPFTGSVATFSDTNTTNVPGDFTATINWGDGNTTAGTVTGGAGSFTVSGTHTYATNGGFELIGSLPVAVTLADDPPGTATATANSTANVSAALAPASAVPALHFYGLLALAFVLGITAVTRLQGHV
jgi:hypothetical protein